MQYELKIIILMISLSVPMIALIFYHSVAKNRFIFIVLNIFQFLVISKLIVEIGEIIYDNYLQPWEWYFLSFWLNGQVASAGENFYISENYLNILLPYDVSEEFRTEIINVGFWYPPFTMFLFTPLAFFDVSNSYLIWQAVNMLICGLCIFLIWNMFLKEYGTLSFLLAALLFFGLYPTQETFKFAQTNFWALLFFLFFWKNRTSPWGGLWATFCVGIKPYLAILYLYLLLTRRWKSLALAMLMLLALISISIVAFSPETVATYINKPIPDLPHWIYTEPTNQSLLATILRFSQYTPDNVSVTLNPWYLGISIAASIMTVFVTIKYDNKNGDWVALSLLFFALIVYPGNQRFYSVFIILPTILLLQYVGVNIKYKWLIIPIIVFTYFLTWIIDGGFTFWANGLMWIVCIILAAKMKNFTSQVSAPS